MEIDAIVIVGLVSLLIGSIGFIYIAVFLGMLMGAVSRSVARIPLYFGCLGQSMR